MKFRGAGKGFYPGAAIYRRQAAAITADSPPESQPSDPRPCHAIICIGI